MADFSRKHYVLVANIIELQLFDIKCSSDPLDEFNNGRTSAITSTAIKFAEMFGADNSQFDWHRFYTACGLDADKLLSEEA